MVTLQLSDPYLVKFIMDFTITQISILIVLHFLFGVCPSAVEDKEKEKDA